MRIRTDLIGYSTSMRVFSRWLPLLFLFDVISIILLLCLAGIIPVSYAIDPPRMNAQRPPQAIGCAEDYYRDQLSGRQLEVYDSLEHAYRTLAPVADVPNGTTEEDLRIATAYVLADNPDIFWVNTGYNYQAELWGVASVSIHYLYDDPDQIIEMSARYEQQANAIIAEMQEVMDPSMQPETDPYGYNLCMAKNLYLWIIRNVEYNAIDGYDQTISTVFDDHITVCAGYARAMKYLCDKAGIPCLYVSGGAYNELEESSNGSHAWNVIEIDGNTCYIDVTWGDEGDYADWDWFDTPQDTFYHSHAARFGEAFDRPYWADGHRLEIEEKTTVDPEVKKLMNEYEAEGGILSAYVEGLKTGTEIVQIMEKAKSKIGSENEG